jgi:hypothetical protein
VEVASENLLFISEGTSSWSVNKQPIIINHCVVWICWGELSKDLMISKSRYFAFHKSDKLKTQVVCMRDQDGICESTMLCSKWTYRCSRRWWQHTYRLRGHGI